MDEIYKTAIAMINVMRSKEAIQEYLTLIMAQVKIQISDISVANRKAHMILHAIAKAQQEVYLDVVKDGNYQLMNFNIPQSTMVSVGEFIDDCITNLKVAVFYVEDSLGITNGTLDLFEANATEKGLGLAQKENTDANLLNLFTTRKFAIANSDILKKFTDKKGEILDVAESFRQTTVAKPNTMLNAVAAGIASMVASYNYLKSIQSAAELAIKVYDTYNYDCRIDAKGFVNRPYDDIKKDLESLGV